MDRTDGQGDTGAMDFPLTFATAVGLAMDACAVSASYGARARHDPLRAAGPMIASFGLWQGALFFAGGLAGHGAVALVSRYGRWIAAVVLVVLGVRMGIAAWRGEESQHSQGFPVGRELMTVSLATSLDAAAAGVSFGLVTPSLAMPAVVIGIVTAMLAAVAVGLGQRVGRASGRWAEAFGGAILLAIAAVLARG